MAIPKETTWKMDPHTKAKQEILRRYLQAWFPILNARNNRLVYIDGFCGPGRYDGGEFGSPIIALETAINHTRDMKGELTFYFIDSDERRINHLNQVLENLKFDIPDNFKVHKNCGLFAEQLDRILTLFEGKSVSLAPTFAFIDPFGFSGIPFEIIKRLLKQPKCEVLISLMVDSMNRFIKHPKDKTNQHIVDAFGTDECIRIAETPGDRIKRLRRLYQQQLGKIANFVRHFEMRGRNDRTIYHLFFATNHRLGHVKMKDAMWKVDPEGEFAFSDATDPEQLTLFKLDDIHKLEKKLENNFKGQKHLTGRIVREFIEDETEFIKKHMKTALKELESSGKIKVKPIKTDGKKRKANTYPDEALITFL